MSIVIVLLLIFTLLGGAILFMATEHMKNSNLAQKKEQDYYNCESALLYLYATNNYEQFDTEATVEPTVTLPDNCKFFKDVKVTWNATSKKLKAVGKFRACEMEIGDQNNGGGDGKPPLYEDLETFLQDKTPDETYGGNDKFGDKYKDNATIESKYIIATGNVDTNNNLTLRDSILHIKGIVNNFKNITLINSILIIDATDYSGNITLNNQLPITIDEKSAIYFMLPPGKELNWGNNQGIIGNTLDYDKDSGNRVYGTGNVIAPNNDSKGVPPYYEVPKN